VQQTGCYNIILFLQKVLQHLTPLLLHPQLKSNVECYLKTMDKHLRKAKLLLDCRTLMYRREFCNLLTGAPPGKQ
jgi:hypothetical protein